MGLEYRSYRPGEGPAVVDWYRRVFQVPYTERYWRWQYIDSPLAEPNEIFMCWSGDRLVGHTASIPLEFTVDGELPRVSHTLNGGVDPAYRKRGIFSRIQHEMRDYHERTGTCLYTGLPNAFSYPLLMRTGFYVHLLDLYPWELPVTAAPATRGSSLRVSVTEHIQFTGEDVACFARHLAPYRIRNTRNCAYLNWRFHVNSAKGYRIVRAHDDHRLVGLAVTKVYAPDACLDLVELAAPSDMEVVGALLRAAGRSFAGRRASMFKIFSLEHYLLQPTLVGLGFTREERPTPLLVCAVGAKPTAPWQEPQAWYFSMADSDVY